mgnify:CR=1 FL=1
MNNLQKRILTSLIIFPLSLFFILAGGYYLLFFLLVVFFIANYELFTVFNKRSTILILDLVLILALFSIYYLSKHFYFYILLWVILLSICSDIGGYTFGKVFKWKKFTKISPKKTISGVLGSFLFSLLSVFVIHIIVINSDYKYLNIPINDLINFLDPAYFFLAIIFSLVAQAGDLTISYFKRLEKIKDTGKILPGHGGIFDRIDGLMFVVILTFILVKFNLFWP